MNNIYDYKNNINVITTPNGDSTLEMWDALDDKMERRGA